ncbi:MAG: hypothetical protein WCK73_14695 [Deltaproteobacteria bacterium]
MNLRSLLLAVPLAIVTACGGSTPSGAGSAALDAAAPTYATLAMDQLATDTTPPAATPAMAAPAEQSLAPLAASTGTVCHPLLFSREREVVERVNRHVYKVLGKVEKLLATQPVSATDTSKTWSKTEGGVTFAFTITLVGPNVYGWQLAAGPAGTTPLTVLMTGQIDRNGFTGAHEGKGTMAIDFAKLHAVLPAEKAASGTLDVRFDVSATARKIAARGTNVAWDLDPGKFGGVVPTGLAQPRSGAYLFFREPGKGGSLKIQDEMIFLCGMNPAAGVSALTPATAQVVSRWFRLADGTVHGRADGKISGGVLVAPVASIVGVTCFSATAEQLAPGTAAEPEAYWMMKAEGVAGATLVGLDAGTASSCDASFGAVPSKDGAATDFTAWPASSFDDPPFPFPGM